MTPSGRHTGLWPGRPWGMAYFGNCGRRVHDYDDGRGQRGVGPGHRRGNVLPRATPPALALWHLGSARGSRRGWVCWLGAARCQAIVKRNAPPRKAAQAVHTCTRRHVRGAGCRHEGLSLRMGRWYRRCTDPARLSHSRERMWIGATKLVVTCRVVTITLQGGDGFRCPGPLHQVCTGKRSRLLTHCGGGHCQSQLPFGLHAPRPGSQHAATSLAQAASTLWPR